MFRKAMFLALMSLTTVSLADAPAPIVKIVSLRVAVSAAGELVSVKPSDTSLPEALNRGAAELAHKLRFSPARFDGRAVSSETTLHLTLRLSPTPRGDYTVSLVDAQNGPLYSLLKAPRYPLEQDRRGISAAVLAVISVDENGKPDLSALKFDDVRVSSGDGRSKQAFKLAVQESLRNTRFEMDLVDGKPMAYVARVPYSFCSGSTPDCDGFRTKEAPKIRLAALAKGDAFPEVAFAPALELPPGG